MAGSHFVKRNLIRRHDLKTIFEEEIDPAEVEIELCAQIDKARDQAQHDEDE